MSSGKSVLRKLRALVMRTMPWMIPCQELEGFMVDYLDGALPEQQRRTFDWHLRLCRDCRRYLDAYRRAIALGQAACDAPDEPLPDELVKAILAARDKDS